MAAYLTNSIKSVLGGHFWFEICLLGHFFHGFLQKAKLLQIETNRAIMGGLPPEILPLKQGT